MKHDRDSLNKMDFKYFHNSFSALKAEETSKESASLPPVLPSQETALQDPLNVSLAQAPQSLTVTSTTSAIPMAATSASALTPASAASEVNKTSKAPNVGEGSVPELPEKFQ